MQNQILECRNCGEKNEIPTFEELKYKTFHSLVCKKCKMTLEDARNITPLPEEPVLDRNYFYPANY